MRGLRKYDLRLRLELLESRLYPGDTLLGLWAVALWTPNLISAEAALGIASVEFSSEWSAHSRIANGDGDSRSALSFVDDLQAEERRSPMIEETAATALLFGSAGEWDRPASPMLKARPADLPGMAVGFGTSASNATAGFPGFAFAETALSAGGVAAAFRGSAAPIALLQANTAPLSFDRTTGQLQIREAGGGHTVREGSTADGFVNVTFDGQIHSSNPRSASFDRALAGAAASTVSGIRFDGAAQDTLILDSQHVAGGFTVQATGATVVAENVTTAGNLAIQAPNITVSGALRGSSIDLAASGWVTVEATGRIDAAQLAAGGRIDIAADRFVTSGQLHADGPSGGQVNIQTDSLLNAGPITANGIGPGSNGGVVHIAFSDAYVGTTAAVLSASSVAGAAGYLTLDGGSTGHLFSSGHHLATGSIGGAIDLLGGNVVLAGALLDASGQEGGGSVRIGGIVRGRNSAVEDTQTVTVTPASTIRADAQQSGSGGRVFVDAKQTTTFDGTVSARGGPAGGSGGLIEVSGHGNVSYGGSADAGAPLGKSGMLLLDPKNITISDAPAGVFPQFDLIDPHPARVGFGTAIIVLGNGNIVVTNPNDNFGGMKAGAVYLFDGLTGALISSLVGSHLNDDVGEDLNYAERDVTLLSNGNYVIESPAWNDNRGAVTWGSATTGISGTVSDANSLRAYPNNPLGASISVYS